MEKRTLLIKDNEYELLSRDEHTDYFDEVSRNKRGVFYRLKERKYNKREKGSRRAK